MATQSIRVNGRDYTVTFKRLDLLARFNAIAGGKRLRKAG